MLKSIVISPEPPAPGTTRSWPRRRLVLAALLGSGVAAGGCAGFGAPPLNVALVGVEPLVGEGLEMRLMVKLRLQNPSGAELPFDGIALDLYLRDQRMASGVSAEAGSVPRFGERLIAVPVSVSGLAVLREAMGLVRRGGQPGGLRFAAKGRLGGGALGGRRFVTEGEIDWPPLPAARDAAPVPAAPPARP